MLRVLGVNRMSFLSFNKSTYLLIALTLSYCLSGHASLITESTNFNFGSKGLLDDIANDGIKDVLTRERRLKLESFDSSLGLLTGVKLSYSTEFGLKSIVEAYDPVNNGGKDIAEGESIAESTMLIELFNPYSPSILSEWKQEVADCSKEKWKFPKCRYVSKEDYDFEGSFSLYMMDIQDFLDTSTKFIKIDLNQELSVEAFSSDNDSVVLAYNKYNYWNGTFTIEYEFDAFNVPEPSTLLLFVMGIFAMGFRRFRYIK